MTIDTTTVLPALWQERLATLVNQDTPSNEKVECDATVSLIAKWAIADGLRHEVFRYPDGGNSIEVRWGDGGSRRILLVGHVDTVWPKGETARRPFTTDGVTATGPGIFDMKAGIVVGWWAMTELVAAGELKDCEVVLYVNTDEEVGSPRSRVRMLELAEWAQAGLVLEPAGPPHGALKTARAGRGIYRVQAFGLSAHAGSGHDVGINAIAELAAQATRITGWTNYDAGFQTSIGRFESGRAINQVPDHAEMWVDVRSYTSAGMETLQQRFAALEPIDPRARIEVEGGFPHPTFERNEGSADLYRRAKSVADELGLPAPELQSSATSDACLVATTGTPVLCGLGPTGLGAHALSEHIRIDELAGRVGILKGLVGDLIRHGV